MLSVPLLGMPSTTTIGRVAILECRAIMRPLHRARRHATAGLEGATHYILLCVYIEKINKINNSMLFALQAPASI